MNGFPVKPHTAWNLRAGPAAGRTARLVQARIAVRMRSISRIVAAPALAAMLWGLILFWIAERPSGSTTWAFAATPTVALADLFGSGQAFAPHWWMSLGLMLLIALPGINVGMVLWENIRLKQWTDAAYAAGILAILFAGALAVRR